MQRQNQNVLQCKTLISFGLHPNEKLESRIPILIPRWLSSEKEPVRLSITRPEVPRHQLLYKSKMRVNAGNQGEMGDEDDDLCPVDCVREFKTDEEFIKILDKAKENGGLVVVDFYRTSCGSCKYIEQGFAKLCKGSGDQQAPVIFLKHNVMDEYDEQSEVAERLRIKSVPLFHFYKDGVLLEAFPTRDKERILTAITKYSSSPLQI
ncbi:thioredoxin-like 4, chloroplastic [Cucumis melo]|uniref:Thioredoxin-like 4, chloroplastic n=1 Tax=Cucumis melo TaxID=3656 RepID=A0A1S3BBI1_CUCME|nr:thioredoxin-like 4, chloroplastic [Cucumis melo]